MTTIQSLHFTHEHITINLPFMLEQEAHIAGMVYSWHEECNLTVVIYRCGDKKDVKAQVWDKEEKQLSTSGKQNPPRIWIICM